MSVRIYDVIVLGAGGAGLMCAATAGGRARKVVVLEHQQQPGRKILISGGGRCNFTNVNASPDNYLSANSHFCRSAFARYTPQDFIALVRRHGIAFHEKKLGQLFCNNRASEIVQLLVDECSAAGVAIELGCRINAVSKPERFRVETSRGVFEAPSLVVATGGPSVPKIGATDFGYKLARQFELRVIEPRPALVPLTTPPDFRARFGALSGVSFPAIASANGAAFPENVLLTHRGLSGPAILQISSYWKPGGQIALDLFAGENPTRWLESQRRSGRHLANCLAQKLPQRFVDAWLSPELAQRPVAQLSAVEISALAANLSRWEITPAGTEGWITAEVALGGVDTDELSSKTLEARRVSGLFFIGEVVDVTGWLGGYNFQWAWASGHACGSAA